MGYDWDGVSFVPRDLVGAFNVRRYQRNGLGAKLSVFWPTAIQAVRVKCYFQVVHYSIKSSSF